jgi:hypothetical protein
LPADYEINAELRLVITHASGILTDSDVLDYYTRLKNDPRFDPTYNQLCDLRPVTRIATAPETLRELARSRIFAPAARRAFITQAGADFGLARMFQTFCEIEGTSVGVFKDAREAEAWLGGPGAG